MNEKEILIQGIKALDAVLDTMVFGRPLGMFGELINPKTEEKEEVVVEHKATCEGQPRDKNGRFCKVEVKVTETAPKKEDKTDSKYSLIGKRMKVENDDYTKTLSGRYGYVEGQALTILSEPFDDPDCKDVEFVKVMSEETGREYYVEFRESWLIK